MKVAVIALVILAVIGGGVFFVMQSSDGADANNTSPSTKQTDKSTTSKDAALDSVATITYTDNGWNPETITISAGETVTVQNDSSSSVQFSSNDHPTHTKNSELNLPTLSAGESQTFTPETTGTFGIHDHLNPSKTATVIVQ